jgi:hypothetical protein
METRRDSQAGETADAQAPRQKPDRHVEEAKTQLP